MLPQVRAKAIKCIGSAAEVDSRVLGMAEVQRGVSTALQVRGYMYHSSPLLLPPLLADWLHAPVCLSNRAQPTHGNNATKHTKDDGVSVREAAVELLAKHIVSSPALAEDYFEVLAEASRVSLQVTVVLEAR